MDNVLICGEMATDSRKIFQLFGNVAGEMRLDDIPLAAGVDVNELKKGDEDPLEVVVEIPASKSKRGWNYTANSFGTERGGAMSLSDYYLGIQVR